MYLGLQHFKGYFLVWLGYFLVAEVRARVCNLSVGVRVRCYLVAHNMSVCLSVVVAHLPGRSPASGAQATTTTR
jgi:hypothetical protein